MNWTAEDEGMFRMLLSAVAMHALLSTPPVAASDAEMLARDAVTAADALLKELAK